MRIFNITSLMSYSLAPLEPSVRHYWQRFWRKKEILSVFAGLSRFWFLVIEKNRLAVLFQKFLQFQFHLHQIDENMSVYDLTIFATNICITYINYIKIRLFIGIMRDFNIHYTYIKHTLNIHATYIKPPSFSSLWARWRLVSDSL